MCVLKINRCICLESIKEASSIDGEIKKNYLLVFGNQSLRLYLPIKLSRWCVFFATVVILLGAINTRVVLRDAVC